MVKILSHSRFQKGRKYIKSTKPNDQIVHNSDDAKTALVQMLRKLDTRLRKLTKDINISTNVDYSPSANKTIESLKFRNSLQGSVGKGGGNGDSSKRSL